MTALESDDSGRLLEALTRRFPGACVVLTLGEEGAQLFWKREQQIQSSYPVTALDTTGAGDTFTGFFLAGFLRGDGTAEALRYASAAAAIAVTRRGAAPAIPDREEVSAFLSNDPV